MKKPVLLSLLLMLFAFTAVMAQDEDEAIEELDAPPSLDELLERPKDINVLIVDEFKNSSFNLYDKVVEVRKLGEANGYTEQGIKVAQFSQEYVKLVSATLVMAKNIKTVPKLKLPFAMKSFVMSKKAISHSSAHIKYMKSLFSEEEWKEIEAAAKESEEPAEDGGGK